MSEFLACPKEKEEGGDQASMEKLEFAHSFPFPVVGKLSILHYLFQKFIISSLFPETETLPEVETEEQDELLRPWKVLVLNDPVNLMSYVVMVFRKVFGYDETQATHHMKEVHELGRSVLWVGEREQAEGYVYQLHRWRLQASLEKDD